MDPLSLTAGIIAVLGVGGQVARGIRKLASMRGSPDLVLALNNEISDLQVVVMAIRSVFDGPKSYGVPFPGQRDANIDVSIMTSLQQANDLVHSLEVLYKRLKVSASPKSFSFDRPVWLREQKRIERMKEDIRGVRLKLATALGAHNALTLSHLESYLPGQMQEQKRSNQQAEVLQNKLSVQNETNASNLYEKLDHLRNLQQQLQTTQTQIFQQSETILREPMTRLAHAQERLELRFDAIAAKQIASSAQSILKAEGRASTTHTPTNNMNSSDNSLIAETLLMPVSIARFSCDKECTCICHRPKYRRSPRALDHFLGIFFIQYAGIPYITPPCNSSKCVQSTSGKIPVTYTFPLWLLRRAFSVLAKVHPTSGPELSIRVPYIISEASRIWTLIGKNDVKGMQTLFQRRLGSIYDMSTTGETPLRLAVYTRSIEPCRMLLLEGADPLQVTDLDSARDTAWSMILRNQDAAETCEALQTLFPEDGYFDAQDFSLLHRTVLGLNSLDLNTVLANTSRSSMNSPDVSGKTAFWWATLRNDHDAMASLLKHGADFNQKSSAGWDPLTLAIANKSSKATMLLLGNICDINCDPFGWLPWHRCVCHGFGLDVLHILLARGADVNSTTVHTEYTALLIAVQEKRFHICKFLIAQSVELDKVSSDGASALHLAVWNNCHDELRLLLQCGANYRLKTKAGETLLHYAAQFGDLSCLTILSAFDLRGLHADDRVTGVSTLQRFEAMKGLDASQIANLRDDVSAEWNAMFQKLLDGIRHPESKLPTPIDVDAENFYDAVECLDP